MKRSVLSIFCVAYLAFLLASAVTPKAVHAQLDSDTYNSLIDAWQAAVDAGQFADAEKYALQIKANDERFYPGKVFWKTALGMAYFGQGRYREAVPLFEAEIAFTRRNRGPSQVLVESIINLSAAYVQLGEYEKAKPLLKEGIDMGTRVLGANHSSTLMCMNNLALLHHNTGGLKEAANLYNQVVQGHHRNNERGSIRVGAISNLVDVYVRQGRYQHAEAMSRYGLKTANSIGIGLNHPTTLKLVQNYSNVMVMQKRSAEVVGMLEDAVGRAEKVMGSKHPDYAMMLSALATCYSDLGMSEKAAAARSRSLLILEQQLGRGHHKLLVNNNKLAWDLLFSGNFAEAEQLLRSILSQTKSGDEASQLEVAIIRITLAEALVRQDKFEEAEKLLNTSLKHLQENEAALEFQHNAWRDLARIDWSTGNKERAIERMTKALEIAESTRTYFTGAEFERATSFGWFTYTYELMIGWQFELGDFDACFATMERARARSYLEALNARGVDLFEGMPANERKKLEEQRAELRGKLSTLWAEFEELPAPVANEAAEVAERRQALVQQLRETRNELYQFERDLRASSKAYQRMISAQHEQVTADDARKKLLGDDSLLVSYFIGSYRSFVVAVSSNEVRTFELAILPADANRLGIEAGQLTRDGLHAALQTNDKTAILPMLTNRVDSAEMNSRLHSLWKVLVPAELREEFTTAKYRRIVLLPDGPLALLPFETLVLDTGTDPKYLLDECPPIVYAPSAAILLKLADRPNAEASGFDVLTLGDPLYTRQQPDADQTVSRVGTQRAAAFRAALTPLPFTGVESRWVTQVYEKAGAKVTSLIGAAATESGIRANIEGRELVHLACHGMSDNSFGNFYGMLAVAPGQQTNNPADDGMLTLAETDELDLSACQLAILSACLTNHGPEQQGEGIWALSRGFIIAGARRVMASNWVVHDEAGASLVSVMCTELAKSQAEGKTPDYALALHNAKRWVRKEAKWSHPFYWAPLVLVGQN